MYKIVLMLALAASTTNAANLLQNPGFEADGIAPGSFLNVTNGQLSGWKLFGNADIVGENYSGMPAGNSSQHLDLCGIGGAAIGQSFSVTPSTRYRFAFKHALNDLAVEACGTMLTTVMYRSAMPSTTNDLSWRFETFSPTRATDTNAAVFVTTPAMHSLGAKWTPTVTLGLFYHYVGDKLLHEQLESLGGTNMWRDFEGEFWTPPGTFAVTLIFHGYRPNIPTWPDTYRLSGGQLLDDVVVEIFP